MVAAPIPELDDSGLRRFGLTFAGIVAGLFGVILPLVVGFGYPWWPWVTAIALATWSLVLPRSLRGFYRLWMRFGLIMNAVMSRIVLGFVYYLAVLPTGLVLRLRGKDPMRRAIDPDADSYRVQSEASDPDRMKKPF